MKLKYTYIVGGAYLVVYILSSIPSISGIFWLLRVYLDYPTSPLNEALWSFIYQISFGELALLYGLVNLIVYIIVGLLIDGAIVFYRKITTAEALNKKRFYYIILLFLVLCGIWYIFDKVRTRTYHLNEVGLTITIPSHFVRVYEENPHRRIRFGAGSLKLPNDSEGISVVMFSTLAAQNIFSNYILSRNECTVDINAIKNPQHLSFKDWLIKEDSGAFEKTREDFRINGIWGIKEITHYQTSGDSKSILLPYKDYIFQATYYTGRDPYTEKNPRANEEQCRKDFEQVMASFHFDQPPVVSENTPVSSLLVNHEEHADWKLYPLTAPYNIAFRYPRDMKFDAMQRPGTEPDLNLRIRLYDPTQPLPKDPGQLVGTEFRQIIVKIYDNPTGRLDYYQKVIIRDEKITTTPIGNISVFTVYSNPSQPYLLAHFENSQYLFEITTPYTQKELFEEILKTMHHIANNN